MGGIENRSRRFVRLTYPGTVRNWPNRDWWETGGSLTPSTGIIPSMETVWAPSDIARVYGRTHSVVHRWIKDPQQKFPAPDFMTPAGKPTWRPDTVRAWVASHKPVLQECSGLL